MTGIISLYSELILKLFKGRLTQKDLNSLTEILVKRIKATYNSLEEEKIEDLVQDMLLAAVRTKFSTGSVPGMLNYFKKIYNTKICDHFRSVPDGNIYKRIKLLLSGNRDIFSAEKILKTTRFQPAEWGEMAVTVPLDKFEILQKRAVSFADADMEFETPSDDTLMAYILYLFGLIEDTFDSHYSLTVEDIKCIVAEKLWIIPLPVASYIEEGDMDTGCGSTQQIDYNQITDSELLRSPQDYEKKYVCSLKLEREIKRKLKADAGSIELWMLYMRAVDPETGYEELSGKLKEYPLMKQYGKSALNNRIKELRNWIDKSNIDLNFPGAASVLNEILAPHFERYRVSENHSSGDLQKC